MRFKDYILENGPPPGETFEQVIHNIKKNCQTYFERNPTTPIFRGVSARYMRAGFTPHPAERPPRDSGKAFNFAFNAGYQLAHKVPSVRTRTVFATGDAAMTAEYGELGFFFPVGDFKYGWSADINDSYDEEGEIMSRVGEHFKKMNDSTRPDAEYIGQLFQDLANEITPASWVNNRNDEGEDMTLQVISDQTPNAWWGKVKNAYDKLAESLRVTFDTTYLDNADLEAAVKSGNEILFYRTGGYYMIPYSMVQEKMKEAGLPGTHYNRQERYDWLLEQIKNAQ